MDAEVHRCDGGTSLRGNRTHKGATQCLASQGASVGKSPVCRFLGIHSIWKEDVSVHPLSHLHSEFGWNLRDARGARPNQLYTMVGLQSSVEGGHGDVGLHPHRGAAAVRDPHIEKLVKLYPSCWHLVVSAEDKARSDHLARLQLKATLDHQAGKATPMGWDPHSPSWGPLFRQLLDDQPYWAENVHNPALVWLIMDQMELSGGEQSLRVEKEPASTATSSTTPTRKQQVNKDRREARKKRLKADREELIIGKRERKRKSKRANLLFLEQWKSTLWWFASWLHLPRKGGQASQVFEMWLPWPPFEGLQSRVNQWTRSHPAGGETSVPSDFGAHGDDRQGGDRKRRRDGEEEGDDKRQRGDPREKALDESKIQDLEEYMRGRTFVFLHHFSGPEDRLSMAIQREAERRGVKVKTISTDRLQGGDLLAPQPFEEHLNMAKQGQIDGYHAGWPCSTFSRLRWRSAPNLPGPVRARWAPNGFASNSRSQQKECDDGTVMLARSLCMAQEVNLSREKGASIH